MAGKTLLWVLAGHFLVRQVLTAIVASRSPSSQKVEYLAGRDTIAVLWIGYLYVLAVVLWRVDQSPLGIAQLLGYSLVLCGTALRSFGLVSLRGFYFASTAITENHAVIRNGPFRWLRHPLYLGLQIELLGLTICAEAHHVTLILLVLFLEIQRHVIREQRLLTSRLGSEYQAFCSATWDTSDLLLVRQLIMIWEYVRSVMTAVLRSGLGSARRAREINIDADCIYRV